MRSNTRHLLVLLGDAVIILASFLATYSLLGWLDTKVDPWPAFVRSLQVLWVVVPLHILCLYSADLYRTPRKTELWRFNTRLLLTILVASALSSGCLFFVPEYILGRRPLTLNAPILIIILISWRELLRWIAPPRKRRLVVVAPLTLIQEYRDLLGTMPEAPFDIVAEVAIGDSGRP